MKKLLLLVFTIFCGINFMYAQCTPDPNNQDPISPTPTEGLPCGVVGTQYDEQIDIYLPDSVTTSFGSFPLQEISIDSVVGFPSYISLNPNNVDWSWDALERGCVQLVSSPGEPSAAGAFPITIYAKVTAVVFGVPTDIDTTYTGYVWNVVASGTACPTSVIEKEALLNVSSISNTPNPFSSITNISFTADKPAEYTFTVADLTGRIVYENKIKAHTGTNNIKFNRQKLNSGIYFYSLSEGKASITGKMMVTDK